MSNPFPRIIGITGRKFSGKDTIADMLVKDYGYIKLSYATPLKESCRVIFNLTTEQLYGNQKESVDDYWKVTPREILQFVGTELFRDRIGELLPHIGTDIWVKSVIRTIDANPDSRFVISDVRFPNEVKALQNMDNSKIWRVCRDIESHKYEEHASENQIATLLVDNDIKNNGTLVDLKLQIMELLQ